MLVIIVVLLLCITPVVITLSCNYFITGLGSIPGPLLARFSDLYRFVDACYGQHPQHIIELHQEYGPVVRIGPRAISVSDPRAIDLVLGLKANLDKSDSVNPMMNPYNGEYLPMLIAAKNSKAHARIKRPIAGAYSMTTMLNFESTADEVISKLVSKLKAHQGTRCSIGKWMEFFSFDFILRATFSKDFGFIDSGKDVDGMLAMLDLQFSYIGALGVMPWLDYLLLKNPILLWLLKIPNTLVDFASEQVKYRREKLDEGYEDRADFLAHFFDAQQKHADIVSDLQLTTYAATNVLAASDTTSAALTAIIYHILKYPGVHARVKHEINATNPTFPVPYAIAAKLPYLAAVIREVLRIFPTTGIELERTVSDGGLILPSGHKLPPGAVVGINAWPVHRDKQIFGEDANEFRPERWLQQPNESTNDFDARLQRMQRVFLTFGAGPRACLGRNMAFLQLYKLIATLFGLFEVRVDILNPSPFNQRRAS
jgi:cytochrome P450